MVIFVIDSNNLKLYHSGTRDNDIINVLIDGNSGCLILDKCLDNLNKYYFENKNIEKDSNKWLENSNKIEGSWWPKWMEWLKQHSGELKKVEQINLNKFKEIYKAPGEYVLEK